MNSFGVAPEAQIYFLESDGQKHGRIKDVINSSSLFVYGEGIMGEIKVHRKENDTPLRLLNWVNEYGELGGLRCTDDTSIYIIRDEHLMFCKAKDIRVGDHIPLRYGFEISIDSKVTSNSIVPYVDEYIYCFENISGSDTIIINDVVVELEGAKHDNSRMAAD